MQLLVEEIFVTEGVPQFTFVEPPNYNDILVDIRRSGKPVIIEGQSGTGKTTCVKKILQQLGTASTIQYLTSRDPVDGFAIHDIIHKKTPGTFVIDDFHRLPVAIQSSLADVAKLAAENPEKKDLPKLILIGINQVGATLIQLVDDIAKRCGIHRIQPGDESLISSLIQTGCEQLRIKIPQANLLIKETKGDYWLTQLLCQSVCTMNGIVDNTHEVKTLDFVIDTLRARVVDKLHSAYNPSVKEFCRGQRFRPTNDPYFKLLRVIGQQDNSIVELNMLADSFPDIRGSINNIKEHRLSVLLESKPICAKHFYYNRSNKSFAIEDPALFYYLRHLNWNSLRADCGFKENNKDYEFDIALSFAGENRELASWVAKQLAILDAHVFYDENFEINFLGKAWSEQFKRIFGNDSRLVVTLLDKHHLEKLWPTFERECFQPRVPDGDVVAIFLDSTIFPGIPKDLVHIKFLWDNKDPKWQDRAIDEIVFPVMGKLGSM